MATDYLRRHVSPEALAEVKDAVLLSIEEVISQDKIRTLAIPSDSEQGVLQFSTYGGLLRSVSDIANEKFAGAGQKVLIPSVMDKIKKFMRDKNMDEDSPMGLEILPLLKSILERLAQAKLRADAMIISIFHNLQMTIKDLYSQSGGDEVIVDGEETAGKDRGHHGEYDAASLVNEIMDPSKDSPRIFVINLPEADVARLFCSEIINRVFKNRKNTFTLDPRVVFVFDEAQEFIPYEKRKEDGTEYSSRAVERLLRHGRKYFLHGWISTQRVAHLNTNALQQLHSYFVSTIPRPYDRQLISDTFAIDDAFVDRTLMFQNGDWLMTSFKATNTQNVPVFFHAINNEDSILD